MRSDSDAAGVWSVNLTCLLAVLWMPATPMASVKVAVRVRPVNKRYTFYLHFVGLSTRRRPWQSYCTGTGHESYKGRKLQSLEFSSPGTRSSLPHMGYYAEFYCCWSNSMKVNIEICCKNWTLCKFLIYSHFYYLYFSVYFFHFWSKVPGNDYSLQLSFIIAKVTGRKSSMLTKGPLTKCSFSSDFHFLELLFPLWNFCDREQKVWGIRYL